LENLFQPIAGFDRCKLSSGLTKKNKGGYIKWTG
jgi:hypothetical protein